MKQQLAPIALAAWMLATATTAHATEEAYWTTGVGVDFSSGKYGTTSTTESLSVPVFAQYSAIKWKLILTVPYLQVTGDGSVIVSGRQTSRKTSATSTKRQTISGLGDIVAAASRNLISAQDSTLGIDLSARIKFGTASTTMGSGLNDYAVQTSVYTYVGKFSPGFQVGYEALGDTADQPLNNVAYGAVNGDYQINDNSSAGVEYRYGQRATDTGFEQREASIYANYRFTPDRTISAYLMQGYSDGSPDSGLGLSLSATF